MNAVFVFGGPEVSVFWPCKQRSPSLSDLGYSASESYGIAYKARGLCKTLENLDIFDDDQSFDYGVYGDILNSHLHHNVSCCALYVYVGNVKKIYGDGTWANVSQLAKRVHGKNALEKTLYGILACPISSCISYKAKTRVLYGW